jgi:hypothetical protein
MTHSQVRAILGQHYSKVRIKRNGEVHCYGIMPNSNVTGWFLYSHDIDDVSKYLWG